MRHFCFISILGVVGLFALAPLVTHAFVVSSPESFAGEVNTPAAVEGVEITGTGSEPIPVKLLVTNGTLEMGTTTGLTFTGDETGSTLYFSGSKEAVNTALATLTYTPTTTGSDTLEISLVEPGEVFFPDNGHLYEYIESAGSWNTANTAASNLTRYDATGYLTTITSADENAFVADRLADDGWEQVILVQKVIGNG